MKPPIFIVGVPRSGTTLLAAMLSAHSEMNCGSETHFFRKLSEVDADLLCKQNTWPDAGLEFLGSITHPSFNEKSRAPLLEKYHISSEEVLNYLEGKGPSIGNILSSITEQSMRAAGKRRWVEKTPDHIAYVHDIRKYFPDSPILRIIRDPRDTALSLMTVPWGAEAFIDGLLFWKNFDEKSSTFFDHDPKSYTLRYEELITSPEQELQTICDFIEEGYEEQMLDTSVTGRQVNSLNVPWKSMASKPVDGSRVGLWRSKINKTQNQLAEAILGDRLDTYQYPREEKFIQLGEIFPASSLSAKYEREIERIASTGIRFWKAYNGEQSTTRLYLGDPSEINWLRKGKIEKAIDIFDLSIEIIKSKITKKNIYWIPDRNMDSSWSGYSASILKSLLSPHKVIFEN